MTDPSITGPGSKASHLRREIARAHYKLDRIAHHLTLLLLRSPTSSPTVPTSPTSPTSLSSTGRTSRIGELVKELLLPTGKAIAKWAGEMLLTYGLSRLLPASVLGWLLGWEAVSRIWAWLASWLP
jgi:hypothetical protein